MLSYFMSSVMKKLREDNLRDIKEIAAATRIKESYLKSIENEQYEKLPIEVYARGYIKVYAKYLGVSCETALEPYEKYLEMKAGPKEKKTGDHLLNQPSGEPDESEKYARQDQEEIERNHAFMTLKNKLLIEPIEKMDLRAWYYRPRYIWKGLLLFFVICVVAYALITSGSSHKDVHRQTVAAPTASTAAQNDVQKQDQPNSETVKTDSSTAVVTVKVPTVETAAPQDAQSSARRKHILTLSATEKTWLQLLIDGKDKVEVMMEPGENLSYDAYRSISGTIGNGGGVNIKFNGKPLPKGKKGEVIYLNLPESNPVNKVSPPSTSNGRPEKTI